jgi:hypothetical protein
MSEGSGHSAVSGLCSYRSGENHEKLLQNLFFVILNEVKDLELVDDTISYLRSDLRSE